MGDITKAAALPDSGTKSDLHNLVDNATINAGAVDTAELASGAVTNAKVSDTAAIAGSKLSTLDTIASGAGAIPAANLTNAPVAKGSISRGFEIGDTADDDLEIGDRIYRTDTDDWYKWRGTYFVEEI